MDYDEIKGYQNNQLSIQNAGVKREPAQHISRKDQTGGMQGLYQISDDDEEGSSEEQYYSSGDGKDQSYGDDDIDDEGSDKKVEDVMEAQNVEAIVSDLSADLQDD